MARPQFGAITKRHGSWFHRWYEDGKLKSKKLARYGDEFRTQASVLALANENCHRVKPASGGRVSGNMPIVQFIESEYLPSLAENGRAESTINGYKKIINTHLVKHFGSTTLLDYHSADATRLLTSLAKAGLNRHSVNHVRSTMSGIFRAAVNRRRLTHNPIREAHSERTPKPPTHNPRNPASRYTRNEMRAILTALQNYPEAQLSMALGFCAGLRTGEIAGLQWRDIGSDGTALRVERSVWRGRVTEEKTAGSKREVKPLLDPLPALLLNYRASQEIREPEQWVLMNERGGPLDLHALARRVIRPTMSRHGLEWRGHYAGRRALATRLANQGESGQLAAMHILGHVSIATTRGYYIGTMEETTDREMKRLNAANDGL